MVGCLHKLRFKCAWKPEAALPKNHIQSYTCAPNRSRDQLTSESGLRNRCVPLALGLLGLAYILSSLLYCAWTILRVSEGPTLLGTGPQHTLKENGPSIFFHRLFAGSSIKLVHKRKTPWPWVFLFWERIVEKGWAAKAQNLATGGQKANKLKGVGEQQTCSTRRRQFYGHHWCKCKQRKGKRLSQVILKSNLEAPW